MLRAPQHDTLFDLPNSYGDNTNKGVDDYSTI
jgi:hypothetical protein